MNNHSRQYEEDEVYSAYNHTNNNNQVNSRNQGFHPNQSQMISTYEEFIPKENELNNQQVKEITKNILPSKPGNLGQYESKNVSSYQNEKSFLYR